MYESPIEKIYGEIQSRIVQQDEDNLMYEVRQAVGYKVDKEELLKALQYDRNQYDKGYQDAKAEIGTCNLCKHLIVRVHFTFCEFDVPGAEDGFYCADFEKRGSESEYDCVKCKHDGFICDECENGSKYEEMRGAEDGSN